MHALKNNEKTIPVRIIVVFESSLSTLLENAITITIVNKLHSKSY